MIRLSAFKKKTRYFETYTGAAAMENHEEDPKKNPAMERPNDPAMSHFWVCFQRNANRISKKDLHSPGHCSTVHNSRDTDTARAPVGRCTGKEARHTTHAENYCTPLLHARCRGLKC